MHALTTYRSDAGQEYLQLLPLLTQIFGKLWQCSGNKKSFLNRLLLSIYLIYLCIYICVFILSSRFFGEQTLSWIKKNDLVLFSPLDTRLRTGMLGNTAFHWVHARSHWGLPGSTSLGFWALYCTKTFVQVSVQAWCSFQNIARLIFSPWGSSELLWSTLYFWSCPPSRSQGLN